MLKLRDIMTPDVVTVTPDTTLRDAADLFSRRHVSGAPVVSGADIVGVVSTSDLLEFAGSHPGVPTDEELEPAWADINAPPEPELSELPPDPFFTEPWALADDEPMDEPPAVEGPEWSAFDQHTVEEVMTRRLYALSPDDDVTAAASLMDTARIHRVIVAEEGRLAGIVTATDVAKAVAEHRLRTRTYVFTRQPELDQRAAED